MVFAVVDGVRLARLGLTCEREDARSYLEMCDWDVKAAIEEAVEELAWEAEQTKKQQPKKTLAQKPKKRTITPVSLEKNIELKEIPTTEEDASTKTKETD